MVAYTQYLGAIVKDDVKLVKELSSSNCSIGAEQEKYIQHWYMVGA